MRAGDLLERIAQTGSVTPSRLRPARVAMAALEAAMRESDLAVRRAAARGIPCAVPMLAPLEPPDPS
jgi:hypothetical protein